MSDEQLNATLVDGDASLDASFSEDEQVLPAPFSESAEVIEGAFGETEQTFNLTFSESAPLEASMSATSTGVEADFGEELAVIEEADLSDYYTKAETDEAISAAVEGIDVPDVDLTGYYTKGETDTAIETAVDGIEIPETDLSDYYTKSEVNAQIAAIPTPDVSGQIGTHNVATDAHNDIRLLIQDLVERLNALADSDDTTLDQLSEIVAYIKDNRELVESVTTTKVNVSDIIDNLTTNVGDKPLSAAQGVALKALIDAIEIPAIPTNVSAFANDAGYLTEHQDLSNYYTKAETNDAITEAVSDIEVSAGESGMGLVKMEVDEDGNLYAYYTEAGEVPAFEYDEATGDLYVVIEEG